MITRDAEPVLKKLAGQFKAVALTGPRQSGKSRLARTTFPDKKYVSLENPDIRQAALDDTRGFLNDLPGGAIIDEARRPGILVSFVCTHINLNNLAIECGVDHKTIGAWMGILQASYVIHLLPPFYNNFSKGLVNI